MGGVLAPLFALRGSSDLGVGDTQALHELVDWCAEIGLSVIQILPINETGIDHSPYNILSSLAIEPSTITTTPEFLPELAVEDFSFITSKYDLPRMRAREVCYVEVKALKLELLGAAFKRLSDSAKIRAFRNFQEENKEWLQPYTLFRSMVHLHGQSEFFQHWPAEEREYASAQKWAAELQGEKKIFLEHLQDFYSYIQWIAFSQWQDLRRYAESRKVALMGDIPVGVSLHSADVWAHPHLFDLTRSCGAPAEKEFYVDGFTKNWGQNWGFPLYNWTEMFQNNLSWWRRRLRIWRSIFHMLRIDHVLGFFRMYTFPWYPSDNIRFASLNEEATRGLTGGHLPRFMDQDDSTEGNRQKNRARGEALLRIFLEETEPYHLIAEDLGMVPPYARPSLQELEIPGLKIPIWERDEQGELIRGPDYHRLSLATYGTHDHPPLKARWQQWIQDAASEEPARSHSAVSQMRDLLNFAEHPNSEVPQPFTENLHLALLKGLFACNSWLAVPLITDFFGTEHEFNVPGSAAESNWKTRLEIPVALWMTEKKALISRVQTILKTTCRKILYD